MFFILKLVLIILLNKTYTYIIQDTETILLPACYPTTAKKIPLTLKLFGQLIQLNLHRNDRIVSAEYEIWKYHIKGATANLSQLQASDPCLYIHKDNVSSAIINFCDEHGLEGLVFLKNDNLKIRPLRNNFASLSLVDNICFEEQMNLSFGKSHLIKKSLQSFDTSYFYSFFDNFKPKRRDVRNTEQKLTIELAVFVDDAAYKIHMPILDYNKDRLHNMILAYVNQIQAMFHHPSLGVSIDISLVKLKIMDQHPSELPVFYGDTAKMYTSFCEYAETFNPSGDDNPGHWDLVLLLTGINLFILPNPQDETQRNFDSLGNSFFNGICGLGKYSCAIVEFGATFKTPSAFATTLPVHEIGNVLGIELDDSFTNPMCAKSTHIMRNALYYRNQGTWSECSRKTAKELWNTKLCLRDRSRMKVLDDANELDHSRYHDLPGREWTAKAQCELYLLDKDANVVTLHDICQTLQCESPYHNTYFFAGSALDGTHCALGKECRGGECVPVLEPPYIFKYCYEDNWSEWKEGPCQMSCLTKSKGVIVKRRSCKHGTHRTASCGGPYYDVALCDDKKLCPQYRLTIIEEFTRQKCDNFIDAAELEGVTINLQKGPGKQVYHDIKKPWMACIVFCQQKNLSFFNENSYLTMLDHGINPYFPDGMWCHNENGRNYYCRQHYCLPENYSYEENNCKNVNLMCQ
ncbi:A disintegrin and metalloproteinase with thrombospondin motifs 7-like [Linepithema humile]|uniref:A disintegrin and metalloproteinase with thrombospondin motifs 7-like n=1 Tax=Linepithema humile TaxID=83485 RepID=UPI000623A0BC|nr:PREDICTED: A disintegrin and metalloproteinase with thrombospondin motifs 7-like [Linepithema humile]